jgi:hypothetical protein
MRQKVQWNLNITRILITSSYMYHNTAVIFKNINALRVIFIPCWNRYCGDMKEMKIFNILNVFIII